MVYFEIYCTLSRRSLKENRNRTESYILVFIFRKSQHNELQEKWSHITKHRPWPFEKTFPSLTFIKSVKPGASQRQRTRREKEGEEGERKDRNRKRKGRKFWARIHHHNRPPPTQPRVYLSGTRHKPNSRSKPGPSKPGVRRQPIEGKISSLFIVKGVDFMMSNEHLIHT